MDDRLTLAVKVGVFDSEAHYQHQLCRLEAKRLHRIGNALGGTIFGVLAGTGLLWSQMIGGIA